ncbi:UBX domain-containing protein 6 [Protobothrops mucrosquamatus]|uniref:UBX domain-containing protein 6 n=1 Tax=Protobothrops mucrosquamatus TaxID=103944 RepID=UPI0010FBA9E3|nr:UBX domain-containing protein 6 [Protobothrops mucrosquamatus]
MKKFFQEIKADLKFKTAGPGQKLTESPREKSTKEKPKPDAPKCRQGPTNEAQMAAAAALARLEQKPKPRPPSSQDAIRNQVKKELMAEAAASDKGIPVDQKRHGTCFCARRYLDNIYLHPEEEKYRKIKIQNRVFQERIHCLEGADSFFQAVGFEKVALDVGGQEATEDFYVLKDEALEKLEDLKEQREQLLTGEPVRAQLDRQLRVFKPSPQASRFELPNDFFNLTAEELRREQRMRTEAIEKASMLRTKAMREKEEQRELRRYNYTLVRVRFPDGYILQGTFYAREPVCAVFQFVRETLQNDWLPFELLAPGGHKLTDEGLALNECGLVPSALLTFVWDAEVMADIQASRGEHMGSVLKPDLLLTVQMLS